MKKGSRAGCRTLFVLSPSGQFSPSEPAHVLSAPPQALSTFAGMCLSGSRTRCPIPRGKDSLHSMCTTSCTAAPRLPEGAPGPALCHQHRTCRVHASLRRLSLCQESRPLYRHPASRLLALTNSAPGPSPWETVLRPHLLQHLSLSLSWWRVVLPSETSQPRAGAAGFFCKGPES